MKQIPLLFGPPPCVESFFAWLPRTPETSRAVCGGWHDGHQGLHVWMHRSGAWGSTGDGHEEAWRQLDQIPEPEEP